jgi:hypothetical protein
MYINNTSKKEEATQEIVYYFVEGIYKKNRFLVERLLGRFSFEECVGALPREQKTWLAENVTPCE